MVKYTSLHLLLLTMVTEFEQKSRLLIKHRTQSENSYVTNGLTGDSLLGSNGPFSVPQCLKLLLAVMKLKPLSHFVEHSCR